MKTNITIGIRKILEDKFPDYTPRVIESALEEITKITGKVDYRYLHESLCWDHCSCLEELKKLKESNSGSDITHAK